MKWIVLQIIAVAGLIAIAMWLGDAPTRARWGEDGAASMWTAAGICALASVAAIAPAAVAWLMAPKYLAQTVLAGTAIRILVTGGLALLYQAFTKAHLPSLLVWLLSLYLPLLAVETISNVMLVRAAQPRTTGRKS